MTFSATGLKFGPALICWPLPKGCVSDLEKLGEVEKAILKPHRRPDDFAVEQIGFVTAYKYCEATKYWAILLLGWTVL